MDQGRRPVKDSPKRAREIVARLKKSGGIRVHHVLYTSGRYKVLVSETPNDQSANLSALSTMMAGNVVGETLNAYPIDEIEKVVSKLPSP